MSPLELVTGLYLRAVLALHVSEEDRERGDIPAWVLITIMTAGLVTAVWAVAKPELNGILRTALNSVTSPGGA